MFHDTNSQKSRVLKKLHRFPHRQKLNFSTFSLFYIYFHTSCKTLLILTLNRWLHENLKFFISFYKMSGKTNRRIRSVLNVIEYNAKKILHFMFDTKTYHAMLINEVFNISICNFVFRIAVVDELQYIL